MKFIFFLPSFIFFLGVFFSFYSHSVFASITMTVNQTDISLEDSLQLEVTVEGDSQSSLPEILNTENFDIQNAGTSSQVQIINGNMSQNRSFRFLLTPNPNKIKQPGKIKIGPAIATISGKKQESNSIEITITKAGSPSSSSKSAKDRDRLFYIETQVDNKTPFTNQQIIYRFRLYQRTQLGNIKLQLPEFKGFIKEGPDKEKEAEEILQGVRWHKTEFHFALFPVAPGSLTIEPAQLAADAVVGRTMGDSLFDEFFGMARAKRVNLRSEPISITVQPLPTANRPASFTGLVGDFHLKSQFSKSDPAVGDSTTLTISIEGNGNLRSFALPPFSFSSAKIYEDQPNFQIQPSSPFWKGKKTFKKALVILKPGEQIPPPISIPYFSPTEKTYKLLEQKLPTLQVTGDAKEENSVTHVTAEKETKETNKKKVEVTGKDLMPIKRSVSALQRDSLSKTEKIYLFLLSGFGLLVYLIFFFWQKRKESDSLDLSLSRRKTAYKEFQKNWKILSSKEHSFEESQRLLKEYLGNKFSVDSKAFTSIDIGKRLSSFPLSSELRQELFQFFKEWEEEHYSGSIFSEEKKTRFQERLLFLVQKIEKEVRK